MKIAKGKTAVIAIALFLLFAMVVSLVALPNVNAQTSKTYPVIGVTPNPVGVGQETLIMVGLTQALYATTDGWEDISVTITRPDGIVETISGIRTDSTGLTGRIYVPTLAGNYTLQMHFPAQWYNFSGYIIFGTVFVESSVFYEASDSEEITLAVQEEPIPYYPGHPLPTEYWTRPIDDQLREWAPIAGNWLMTPRNFYAVGNDYAPDTAHILWTKPLTSGGLVGGALNAYQATEEDVTNVGYETGDAYEGKWGGLGGGAPIVMGGKLYYQKYAANDMYKETTCVDLHTGEELWSRVLLNNLSISFGQLMYWQTYDVYGVYDYLWAQVGPRGGPYNWHAFDPFTGDWVYDLEGVPAGTFDYGPKGEMLMYTVDLAHGWMTLWNSTNIPDLYGRTEYASPEWGQWRPMGKTVNATSSVNVHINYVPYTAPTTPLGLNGYQWNKTIPTGLQGRVNAVFTQDKVIGTLINTTDVISWGISLKPGQEGTLLFNNDWKAPSEWAEGSLTVSFGAISDIDGVFTVQAKESRLHYGFSTETGKYLWTISEPIAMLGHLMGGPPGERGTIAYGKLFCGTMSGVIQAYDVTNGQLVWTYNVNDPYMQVLWSNNFPMGHLIVTDGKIYIANLEHSVNQPLPRGGPFICLNATTGEEIWRADGLFRSSVWGGRAVIGDSIIATMDTYDQRIYGIGKGQSATTVTSPDTVQSFGKPVLLKGMVTDVSPGTKDAGLEMRFPDGVPAVADENMSEWMLYVYKQFERPADVVGVEVVLSVLDPNNNCYEVGRATSDSDGFFSCAFTPEVPGKYTIIASFEGSGAYYGSHAKNAINVEDAPVSTPEPTPTPAPMTDMYILGSTVGIIVAIVVVGLLLVLLLRKR